MKRLLLFLALALSSSLFIQTAFGEEKTYPDLNCALTIPEGWFDVTQAMQVQGMVAAYAKPDQTEIIFLTAYKQPAKSEVLDEKFIANFELGITESGGPTLVDGKIIDFAGLKSYSRIGVLDKGGKHLSSKTLAIPTKDFFYTVNVFRFDGLATADPELEKVFSDFRFLNQPQPPTGKDAAYKIGYFLGSHAIAIFFGFIVIVGGFVALIVYLIKKQSRRHSRHS